MKKAYGTTGHETYRNRIFNWLPNVIAALLMVIPIAACSKQADNTRQPAKPPEPKNQTYRMVGGQSVISLVSSDELEIRQGGENLICKYTKQDGRLRVVVNVLGTTTAKYFNMTPEGLVDEDGDTYYEPATYDKVTRQIELNRQLLAAVKRNDGDAVEELLSKGASQKTSDSENNAFTIAVEEHHPAALAVLLRHGADPNQETSSKGETALFVAVSKGYTQIVEMLIKGGARVNNKDGVGATPLIHASAFAGTWGAKRTEQHDAIVSLLIDAKADLNARDDSGATALACALINNNLKAAKLLVEAGADRSLGKETGQDAYSLAKQDANKLFAIKTNSELSQEAEQQRARIAEQRRMIIQELQSELPVFGQDDEDQPFVLRIKSIDSESGSIKGSLFYFLPYDGRTNTFEATLVDERLTLRTLRYTDVNAQLASDVQYDLDYGVGKFSGRSTVVGSGDSKNATIWIDKQQREKMSRLMAAVTPTRTIVKMILKQDTHHYDPNPTITLTDTYILVDNQRKTDEMRCFVDIDEIEPWSSGELRIGTGRYLYFIEFHEKGECDRFLLELRNAYKDWSSKYPELALIKPK